LLWWILLAVAVAIPLFLFSLFRWASADPEIDREISRERFRAQQEMRWLRRSHANGPPAASDRQPLSGTTKS
jgi:hypothetical protein